MAPAVNRRATDKPDRVINFPDGKTRQGIYLDKLLRHTTKIYETVAKELGKMLGMIPRAEKNRLKEWMIATFGANRLAQYRYFVCVLITHYIGAHNISSVAAQGFIKRAGENRSLKGTIIA